MNKIDQSAIETLAQPQTGTVLSIYVPTHHIATPATIQEDQTRLKNCIRQGFNEWRRTANAQKLKNIQATLDGLTSDADFWDDPGRALAVFASEDEVKLYRLPLECEEYVYVGDEYELMPLRMCLQRNQPFYVFALALHNPKLFKGDIHGLEPVDINFPASPEDALNIDEMFSNSNTVRGVTIGGGGNGKLSPHGQGDSNHAGQEERLKYFRILDHMIMTAKNIDASLPVVIAATDNEASDFKHLSKLPALVQTCVPGNHTLTTLGELHGLAWHIINEEIVGKKMTALVEQFNERKGTVTASDTLADIAAAAETGRVDTLVLGMLSPTNDSVEDATVAPALKISFSDEYDQYRIRELAATVLRNGGSVCGVDPAPLGSGSKVGALYRY